MTDTTRLKAPLERASRTARLIMLASFMACSATFAIFRAPLLANVDALTDAEITEAIETQFRIQKGVPFNRIDVETEDGVVTLRGLAFHVLAKERASVMAQGVRGVLGVVNRIAVLPPARSDSSIRNDITRALFRNRATEGRDARIWVREGEVTLTGTVESAREKELVGLVAKGILGVKSVQNDIVVEPEALRPATEIKEEIVETLRWDTLVDDALIAVHVDDAGRVALAGVVGSAAEKERAIEQSRVQGVVEVTAAELEIDPRARREELRGDKFAPRTDEEIRAAVERVFQHDPRVRPFHPVVAVRDGIVTLRGVVNQLRARRLAEEDARTVRGVWHVRNLLKVKPGDPVSDDETAENVRETLRLDPYVQRRGIEVAVHDGEVRLEGSVGSKFEKRRAESAASIAAGVVAVHNELRVSHDGANDGKSDWAIARDIRQELAWSPFVAADDVRVEVEDGTATLSGRVDTWMEWKSAEENAFEGGAAEVHNHLEVRYGPEARQPSTQN
ncbi:MAG TPA: BON domain-containing protein [Vicinamibacteria bacterium]|nr:BON domain-containing protein [Vicinamibacteria bacterium]